ncbi:cytochrome d ubiquinol oxidase subunit II [Ktedonosporobacter rubrisoli]|uniref:Cytochrome d ubiquinol oxidase subunit II n=1 Tax=Ktedonosporobacter rubrisoli TaxID=2509675 RepID=A0A4P6JU75_KTERU|nr:cytochrome d ubiquinol oxidase subunit II [Ktedonosporobacter rubrisoli]QBD78842.1 cytochrome d ubiquinol oxidase subunit II [Ktedonosporobacter rubrisoli]
MDLHVLWYILIGALFTGYFILEGYDYGLGILLPFLSRDDRERRLFLNAMGPFWLGNETWLVAAIGAIFAAFPAWYGTFLSSFYLLIVALLISLMLRGAGIEFRNHHRSPRWRAFWDWIIFGGSLLPGLIWGVIAAAVFQGLPLDAHRHYTGTFWQLFSPLALIWGLTFVALFALHGALFLSVRLDASVTQRISRAARMLWLPVVLLIVLLAIVGSISSIALQHLLVTPWIAPFGLLVLLALLLAGFSLRRQQWMQALMLTSLAMAFAALALGLSLFPTVLPSSLQAAWNLTIENTGASSSSLVILSWCGLVVLPIVIGYQSFCHWLFRKRLNEQSPLHF